MRTLPVLIGVMAVVLLSLISSANAASVANVSGATLHTVVLMSDGTVWTWGSHDNPRGILGTGSGQSDGNLHQVSGLPAIVTIEANFRTSLAIDKDGRVWAWGDNEYGQCADGQTPEFWTPTLISGLSHIVQVSNGGLHCVAVDDSGRVWAWGDNLYGQLGQGYAGPAQYTPVQVPISDVKMVTAGRGYTVALKKDGTVWAWGENTYGMTGDSYSGNTLTPTKVQGLSSIVKIDAGMDHTLALRDDGTVWGWGDGKQNNLLNGQGYYGVATVSVPVQIGNLPAAADIAAADYSSMALDRNGSVYVWGSNGDGQYGNSIDLETPETTPQKVPGLGDVVSISTGLGHCLAVKKDGSVWVWGRNQEDQVQPGKGKKVMAPMKKIDGSKVIPGQPTSTTGASPVPGQQATTDPQANSDLTLYVTAGGVILLALAVIGAIVLIRLRK